MNCEENEGNWVGLNKGEEREGGGGGGWGVVTGYGLQ